MATHWRLHQQEVGMSLRDRAEAAFAAGQRHTADGPTPTWSSDDQARAEAAIRPRILRWCQRMGVTNPPDSIALERQSSAEHRRAGWFRFTVEDLEFWARTDSDGKFDVFVADSAPHDGPIRDLADLGRVLAARASSAH
jgi:hypothetical protein